MFSKLAQKYTLPLILITAFIDVVGIGILIPVLPSLIASFGQSGEWVAYTAAIYSLGTFAGGFIFGPLSDRLGRKPMLICTSLANTLGYAILIFSPTFVWFLIARLISGLGGAGFGVIQAYISDISAPADRARKLWLMGAAFGFGFLIGPALGGALSLISVYAVAIAGIIVTLINAIAIYTILPESHKLSLAEEKALDAEIVATPSVTTILGIPRPLILLFAITFIATLAFSPIQTLSGQYYTDLFRFTPIDISLVLVVVGISAILYQGLAIKYVRRYLSEWQMVLMGFGLLAIAFAQMSMLTMAVWIWPFLALFAIGNGSILPSVAALIGRNSGDQLGKYLGFNSSAQSLASIIGPIAGGTLYAIAIRLPFITSAGLFVLAGVSIALIKRRALFGILK
jgi:MFS transporter, DHA1 family, tetracycline resistance protein